MNNTLLTLFVLAVNAITVAAPLYLVSGEANRKSPAKLPVNLFRLDPSGGLTLVRIVSPGTVGAEFIHQSLDARVVVVGAHSDDAWPSKLMMIDFDDPARILDFQMPEGQVTRFGSQFLDVPGAGWVYALSGLTSAPFVRNKPQIVSPRIQTFYGVRLEGLASGKGLVGETIPPSWYSGATIEGEAGPPGTWNFDNEGLSIDADSRTIRLGQVAVTLNWPPVPADWRPAPSSPMAELRAANRKVVVLSAPAKPLLIYDAKSLSWNTIAVPRPAAHYAIKLLGEYVALTPWERVPDEHVRMMRARLIERNRAAIQRAKVEPNTKVIVDTKDIDLSDSRRTGGYFLYNAVTRMMIEMSSGREDIEVLLVDGDFIYYRSSDELTRVRLQGNRLGKPEVLAKDAAIRSVHWAFVGRD